MLELSAYLGLFLAAVGAATLLPLQSEAALVGLILADQYPVPVLLAVATLGNVLGAAINWVLGRSVVQWRGRRWFPISAIRLARAERFYQRAGYWSLLLSWAPIVGDPLTLVAGFLREPLWRFLLLVTVAKGARYLALAGLTVDWI